MTISSFRRWIQQLFQKPLDELTWNWPHLCALKDGGWLSWSMIYFPSTAPWAQHFSLTFPSALVWAITKCQYGNPKTVMVNTVNVKDYICTLEADSLHFELLFSNKASRLNCCTLAWMKVRCLGRDEQCESKRLQSVTEQSFKSQK